MSPAPGAEYLHWFWIYALVFCYLNIEWNKVIYCSTIFHFYSCDLFWITLNLRNVIYRRYRILRTSHRLPYVDRSSRRISVELQNWSELPSSISSSKSSINILWSAAFIASIECFNKILCLEEKSGTIPNFISNIALYIPEYMNIDFFLW